MGYPQGFYRVSVRGEFERALYQERSHISPTLAVFKDNDLVLRVDVFYDKTTNWNWNKVIFQDMVGWVCGWLEEFKDESLSLSTQGELQDHSPRQAIGFSNHGFHPRYGLGSLD